MRNIREVKISNSIDAQFKIDILTERVQRALGRKKGGFSSLLDTLNFISILFAMFFALIILIVIAILRIVSFFKNQEDFNPDNTYLHELIENNQEVIKYLQKGLSLEQIADITNEDIRVVKIVATAMDEVSTQ